MTSNAIQQFLIDFDESLLSEQTGEDTRAAEEEATASTSTPGGRATWEEEGVPQDVQLQMQAKTLLTQREFNVENFIRNFCTEGEGEGSNEPDVLLDESDEQALLGEAENKLAEASLMLSHKYGSVLKEYLSRKQQLGFVKSYSKLPKSLSSYLNLCLAYSKAFERWIGSEHVSFSTLNKTGLGALTAKESFVVHLFSMATCRRVKGDDCFALSVVGRSSVGKTRIIEHCLQQASFTYASEQGVGRFNVKDRPILMYRDIDIEKLVKGADSSKFRTICRSEMTAVKIFSSTVTLPPLWVMVSANQRINDHRFPVNNLKRKLPSSPLSAAAATAAAAAHSQNKTKKVELKPSTLGSGAFVLPSASSGARYTATKNGPTCVIPLMPPSYPSQLTKPGKRTEILEESVRAVQNRVLELYVRDRPDLTDTPLPNGVVFQRTHLVVGIYDMVIGILSNHLSQDFHSPVLLSYVLTGLCDNFALYKRHWGDEEAARANKSRVANLVLQHVSDKVQQKAYLDRLGPVAAVTPDTVHV